MTTVPLGFCEREGPVPGHICLFHDTDAELRAAQLAFLRPAVDDLRQGILLLGPPGVGRHLLGVLESEVGRSLAGDVSSGRVALGVADRDGDQQLESYVTALDALIERGCEVIRAVAPVAWDAPGFAPPEDFLWIESRLNEIVAERRTIMLCTYDLGELPDDALTCGGLETHPLYALGGELVENPSFIEPARFMESRLLHLRWLTP
jgi:hypothetical protein